MADVPFAWEDLARYKAEGRFLDGYPHDQRTFFAPRDHVHELLVTLLGSAQHSIVVNMFGYDDDELKQFRIPMDEVLWLAAEIFAGALDYVGLSVSCFVRYVPGLYLWMGTPLPPLPLNHWNHRVSGNLFPES